jgi:dTDP-4-dehydrorhamnose 3,5-epimerase
MNVIKTGFEGLILIEPKVYVDTRGLFYESWQQDHYEQLGIKDCFVQDDISISYKNVLRGMHYQKNQGKLVSVIHGSILDVTVDLRLGSSTYLKHFVVEISSGLVKQLYIPPGFAHGFYVLSDRAIMSYKCTQYYDKSGEGGIIWNDSTLNIKWPCTFPIVSEKDSRLLPYGGCDASSRIVLS